MFRHAPFPRLKGGVVGLPAELPPRLQDGTESSSTLPHLCGRECKQPPRLSAHVLAGDLCAWVSRCPSVLCAQDAETGVASSPLQSRRFLFKKPPSFEVLQCRSTSCFDLGPSQPENRLVISSFISTRDVCLPLNASDGTFARYTSAAIVSGFKMASGQTKSKRLKPVAFVGCSARNVQLKRDALKTSCRQDCVFGTASDLSLPYQIKDD